MIIDKFQLPNVTLIAVTGKDLKGHQEALDYSCIGIEFGAVKLIEKHSNTIDDWNEYIIYHLKDHVDTEHCMLIHADGYIIHPELWKDEWLEYDYAGSPWPLPQDNFSYLDEEGELQRVGNSVGLRSKKLLELIATRPEEYFWSFKQKYGNTNEDGFITCHNRKWLEKQGCKFMPFSEALTFGKEAPLPENEGKDTFLFHKYG